MLYFDNRVKSVDGRVSRRCRQYKQKNCKGFVWMRDGHIDGLVREHSHLPPDQPPVEIPKKRPNAFKHFYVTLISALRLGDKSKIMFRVENIEP